MWGEFIPLAKLLFMHDKVDHIHASPVRGAVGREAKSRMGFPVHLQARGLVRVKGAVQPEVLIGF